MASLQTVDQKKGEIEFRSRLFKQQVEDVCTFGDEFSKEEMLEVMRQRVQKSRKDFEVLDRTGFLRSPFLELGAERCQRSLLLANEFGLDGFAADLSSHSLKYATFFAETMGAKRIPTRVCCDAYHLPLSDNSIAFAFCYQTLHHFPDPLPVLRELYRVLRPGGVLYIDEEPISRKWRLHLWQRKAKIHSVHNKYFQFLRNYFSDFLSVPSCNERQFGICENDEISLAEWETALAAVGGRDQLRTTLLPGPFRNLTTMNHSPSHWRLGSHLVNGLGGTLSATVVAEKDAMPVERSDQPLLACVACRDVLHQAADASFLFCAKCGTRYPIVDGISYLLPSQQLEALYPEIYGQGVA